MKDYLGQKLKDCRRIEKIRGEASVRGFFRLFFDKYTLVAMVYPEENHEEIERIVRLTRVYLDNGILVPGIEETLDDRVIIQQDLGDLLVQKAYKRCSQKEREGILQQAAAILARLRRIETRHTAAILDHARMKWEVDFFIQHFAKNFLKGDIDFDKLRERLHAGVERIEDIAVFAHRDFHSRNMLLHKDRIYLVDFQDSLVAPPFYDLASFAFDSYLDLKSLEKLLIKEFAEKAAAIDREQLLLTALQRNIKALGTFGFQVTKKRNLSYKKYIPRTLRRIVENPLADRLIDSKDFGL